MLHTEKHSVVPVFEHNKEVQGIKVPRNKGLNDSPSVMESLAPSLITKGCIILHPFFCFICDFLHSNEII